MKKAVVTFLLVCVMAFSSVPAMASTAVTQEIVQETSYQEIVPFFEITIIYHRWCGCCDRLQFRVWGAISGRWLTDWQYV